MTAAGLPIAPERVKTAQACSITGLSERRLQWWSKRGKIPGYAKILGSCTWDEAKLRAWVAEREAESCPDQMTAPAPEPIAPPFDKGSGPPVVEKPRGTRSGAARRFTAASASRESSPGGRYEQAMSNLLAPASRKTSRR